MWMVHKIIVVFQNVELVLVCSAIDVSTVDLCDLRHPWKSGQALVIWYGFMYNTCHLGIHYQVFVLQLFSKWIDGMWRICGQIHKCLVGAYSVYNIYFRPFKLTHTYFQQGLKNGWHFSICPGGQPVPCSCLAGWHWTWHEWRVRRSTYKARSLSCSRTEDWNACSSNGIINSWASGGAAFVAHIIHNKKCCQTLVNMPLFWCHSVHKHMMFKTFKDLSVAQTFIACCMWPAKDTLLWPLTSVSVAVPAPVTTTASARCTGRPSAATQALRRCWSSAAPGREPPTWGTTRHFTWPPPTVTDPSSSWWVRHGPWGWHAAHGHRPVVQLVSETRAMGMTRRPRSPTRRTAGEWDTDRPTLSGLMWSVPSTPAQGSRLCIVHQPVLMMKHSSSWVQNWERLRSYLA